MLTSDCPGGTMTTGQSDRNRRQDAVTSAASNTHWRMRQAVTEIAEAGGAQVCERRYSAIRSR
jgi:hypothetical protein